MYSFNGIYNYFYVCISLMVFILIYLFMYSLMLFIIIYLCVYFFNDIYLNSDLLSVDLESSGTHVET